MYIIQNGVGSKQIDWRLLNKTDRFHWGVLNHYSHQSKTHHSGVLTVMIMVGICHQRIPTIEYNGDDDNDNEKT